MQKKSLIRPFGWFVWLAMVFIAPNQDVWPLPNILVKMMILTLGMPEALRRGLAKCASRTKVIGMTITALLLTALLTAAAPWSFNMLGYAIMIPSLKYSIITSGAIIGVRCMEEYFYADGDTTSAVLLDVLAAAAVYATTMMGCLNLLITCIVMLGVLLLGILIALITGRKHARTGEKLRLEIVPLIREIPAALLRVALYPAAIFCLRVENLFMEHIGYDFIMLLMIGLLLVEMLRSTFRRDDRDAVGYVLPVTHVCLLLAVVLAGIQLYQGTAGDSGIARGFFIYTAAGVLMLLYAPLNGRMILSGALLLLLCLFPNITPFFWDYSFVIVGITAVAALLMIPEWRELIRVQKVKRIRAKAMRGRK